MKENRVLTIDNLTTTFESHKQKIQAVRGVSLHVDEGDILAIVGESGSGKSVTMKSVMGLLGENADVQADHLELLQKDLLSMSEKEKRKMRGKDMAMIFQDPFSSLDPRQTAESIVGESLLIHKLVKTREEYEQRVDELLRMVDLDPSMKNRVPHEFSGGQRQRIVIARALILEPKFIFCDEPVSALDVSVRAQVLNLMKDLQKEFNLTYMFISHDLSVVRFLCDRIGVMYLGRMVEIADRQELYDNPMHPYTKALLSAIPVPDVDVKHEPMLLEGDIPSPYNPPKGCLFHTRCKFAMECCKTEVPQMRQIGENHCVACHLYDDVK